MNVFLDTNIYLSFYQLSSDDLEELKNLAVLVRQGKIRLLVPRQVVEEFRRNREEAISDALKLLKEQRRSLQLPQLARQYPEYAQAVKAQKEIVKALGQLVDHIQRDALSRALDADSVIEELFEVGHNIEISSKDINNAERRMRSGSPPGKKGSIGDALNWQALLRHVRRGQDLHFVSDDADFYSPLAPAVLHEYLRHEWHEANRSEIKPYTRLSAFLAEHFPDIKLASELEKDILIRSLENAASFAETHAAVLGLSKYTKFTRDQVNAIIKAAVTNNQVYWIGRDPDVHAFLSKVIEGREDIIEPTALKKIQYVLNEIEPYGEIPS